MFERACAKLESAEPFAQRAQADAPLPNLVIEPPQGPLDSELRDADCKPADVTKVELSSPSSESDDDDYIMDSKICIDAMESAAGAMAMAMIHGPSVMHQFHIKCYLVGKSSSNTCADCDKRVSVTEGTLFGSKASECSQCNRKRCFACTSRSMRVDMARDKHCLRCAPGAPSDYKTLSQLALMRKKQGAKK